MNLKYALQGVSSIYRVSLEKTGALYSYKKILQLCQMSDLEAIATYKRSDPDMLKGVNLDWS